MNANIGLDVVRNMSTGVPPQSATAGGGTFHPLTPQRILDTRTGLGAPGARLGPGGTLSLQVAGAGGVPASGARAVVLNMTADQIYEGVEKALRKYFGKRGDRVVKDNLTCVRRGYEELGDVPQSVIQQTPVSV